MLQTTNDLALRYRPLTFEDMVGQRAVTVTLREMVRQDKVPGLLLFAGTRGTGKTSSARILAAALNCEALPAGPCNQCPSCLAVAAGQSASVLEVDAASNGTVAEMRELRDSLQYAAAGQHRVILLDEAHAASREAQSSLLVTLEDLPAYTTVILLTTDPDKLLDTLVSRAIRFDFTRLTPEQITARLQHIVQTEGAQIPTDVLAAVAQRARGGMRDAVKALQQLLSVNICTVEDFQALFGEQDFAPALFERLIHGDVASAFDILDAQLVRCSEPTKMGDALANTLIDVMRLQAGGTVAHTGDALTIRQELARQLPAAKVTPALRLLWDLKTKLRSGDDLTAMLQLVVALLAEPLGPPTAVIAHAPAATDSPVAPVAAPPKILTLAEMRRHP